MLLVVKPFSREMEREIRMDRVLADALAGVDVQYLLTAEALAETDLRNRKILFAVCLSEAGVNLEYYRMLEHFRQHPGCLKGAAGVILVDGSGDLFTKSLARRLAFSANLAGCTFPGRPLVEATGSLYNFQTLSRINAVSCEEAYAMQVKLLVKRILDYVPYESCGRNILVVHASSRKSSNRLLLWEKIRSRLYEPEGERSITEISLRNGHMTDCRGCRYETCLHYGEQGSCFYGGIMTDQVYPAIISCDTLVMICPNYNDAVGANITAFINRLTSVFQTNDFSGKRVFAIVVSGYSGGDIVAEQIIGAMNLNKGFILPGNFALMETANDPKSVLKIDGIDEKAAGFAAQIAGKMKAV